MGLGLYPTLATRQNYVGIGWRMSEDRAGPKNRLLAMNDTNCAASVTERQKATAEMRDEDGGWEIVTSGENGDG